jgi:hypothetical protein
MVKDENVEKPVHALRHLMSKIGRSDTTMQKFPELLQDVAKIIINSNQINQLDFMTLTQLHKDFSRAYSCLANSRNISSIRNLLEETTN